MHQWAACPAPLELSQDAEVVRARAALLQTRLCLKRLVNRREPRPWPRALLVPRHELVGGDASNVAAAHWGRTWSLMALL